MLRTVYTRGDMLTRGLAMKIAIVGCSGHVGYVLDGLGEARGISLVAVAPGSPEEDMSPLLGHPEVSEHRPSRFEDYRVMLDNAKPDVVCVNPFFYLHSRVTVEALSRGIHVFCEKPLAITHESLDEVRCAQSRSGAAIGMMLNYRYDPRFRAAHRLVREGAIGEPVLGYAQKSYRFGERPDYYKRRETFGGLIPWVGIHAIDWFRWVSGVSYTSVVARHANTNSPDYPDLEDTATCLFELSTGGSAVMSFDYLRPQAAPTHGDDRLRLVGTRGVLEIRDDFGLVLTNEAGDQSVEVDVPPAGLFADFVASIREGADCAVTTDDAIDVTRVCLLARDAADSGERVVLT